MHDDETLSGILRSLPLITAEGPWWRAVADQSLQAPPAGFPIDSGPQPLWAGGAKIRGQRFTPRGKRSFDSLYLSSDSATVVAEINSVIFSSASILPGRAHLPQTLFTIDGRVARVLDLLDGDSLNALGTTHDELLAEFRLAQKRFLGGLGPMPESQRLGRAAYRSRRIAGLRYPSRKRAGGVNLVVFTARLDGANGDFLEVITETDRLRQRLP